MRRLAVVGALVLALGLAAGGQSAPCTREHKGDLVLSGEQSLSVSGGVFCVDGEITLRDQARLVLTGVTLRLRTQEGVWQSPSYIRVFGTARLELHDVTFETTTWVDAFDEAVVLLDRVLPVVEVVGVNLTSSGDSSVEVTDSTLNEIRVRDRAHVFVRGSSVRWFLSLNFSQGMGPTLSQLRPGVHYDSWECPRGTRGGFSLRLEDTTVGGWSVEVSNGGKVTVSDSDLSRVTVDLTAPLGELSNVRPGYVSSWNLRTDGGAVCPEDITLIRTRVGHYGVGISGLRSAFRIVTSQITGLWFGDSSCDLLLDRVALDALSAWDSFLSITSNWASLSRGVELHASRVNITGPFQCPVGSIVILDQSRVVREFETQVTELGKSGHVGGATVEVEDISGDVIHLTTNSDGVARFTLAFTERDFQGPRAMKVSFGERSTSRSIGLNLPRFSGQCTPRRGDR